MRQNNDGDGGVRSEVEVSYRKYRELAHSRFQASPGRCVFVSNDLMVE